MKKQKDVLRFIALPIRIKILPLFLLIGLLFVSCSTPFASSDSESTIEARVVTTIAIPTETRANPSATFTATATLTRTPTIENTSTSTALPTDTLTPTFTVQPTETSTPIPTHTPIVLDSCLPANPVVEYAKVVRIVDGDTIDVDINGVEVTVRYIGIDTPENGDTYFLEASNRNSELVLGKDVILVSDVSDTDRYQRLLRYVFVNGTFVNEILVQEGYAYANEYPPDTSCSSIFTAAQNTASTRVAGIWVPTPTIALVLTQPAAGSGGCPQGCVEEKPGCDIKGNINSKGEKIYHDHSSSSYSATKIDPSKGERWFCTAQEAVANGWRAPRN